MLGGAPQTILSNNASVRVEELLDLRLAAGTRTLAITQGVLGNVPFSLTNAGNGAEAFLLSAQIAGIDATVESFAVDVNGNGLFDANTDIRIEPGAATPLIGAGAGLNLLALVRGTGTGSGTLTVTASAATGTGAAGTDFAGKGDHGCDAVTGATTASANATVSLTVGMGSDPAQVTVFKSQAVSAPNGRSEPVRGATITYTIESRFGGSGAVRDARIADLIPTGTAFVPGSLRLDGTALTDSPDADPGNFDGEAIHVALGDVAGQQVRTISFQVKIK
jgi:uncharacterized repeat protein (TIGR01451 family)